MEPFYAIVSERLFTEELVGVKKAVKKASLAPPSACGDIREAMLDIAIAKPLAY